MNPTAGAAAAYRLPFAGLNETATSALTREKSTSRETLISDRQLANGNIKAGDRSTCTRRRFLQASA